MGRHRALDLCCGAGGFSAGLHAAGFDVTGVDSAPQPDYPYRFVLADALTVDLSGYDVIVASPPCQRWSVATPVHLRESHPDVLTPLRDRLILAGVPYVIENVPGAPLLDPILLCGETLRLGVRRHRLFESNVSLTGTGCVHDAEEIVGVYGTHGGRDGSVLASVGRRAMGIDWMPWDRLTESVPPAYGFWIGVQLAAPRSHPSRGRTGTDRKPPAELRHGSQDHSGDGSDRAQDHPRDDCPPAETGPYRYIPVTQATWARPVQSEVPPPQCRFCGARPVSRPATGRWGRYCSHACRQAAYRVREAAQGRIR